MSRRQMTALMLEVTRFVTAKAVLKPDLCHGELDQFKLASGPVFKAWLSDSEKEMTQSLDEIVSNWLVDGPL